MEKTLVILEVSRKQNYIFSSKKLKENAARSAEISYVTGSAFFQEAAGDLYREEDNLVYAGGGHTVLQFKDADTAARFAQKVTEAALRKFRGMEVFVKQIPYDDAITPGENLKALSSALEAKKARRSASFRQMSFGVEALDGTTFLPQCLNSRDAAQTGAPQIMDAPEGWRFPTKFEELAGDDNFIAVVYIDGNAMGKRVENIYARNGGDWDECCRSLRRFSEGIQQDFEYAFLETVERVLQQKDSLGLEGPTLPIRPVILAGDDVCFVTSGSIGLECARAFLESLTALSNEEDQKPYAACAGVALVHTKFPFHQAYDMAEELCGSAKKFGAELNPDGRISAIDWHIEFGQLKDGLSEIRQDYETEDGNRLELRPLSVIVPEAVGAGKLADERTYAFFQTLCGAMQKEVGSIARSKIKALRSALKQGEIESRFFLHDKEIREILYNTFYAKYQTHQQQMEKYRKMFHSGMPIDWQPFQTFDGVKRCLLFDAIEMLDHYHAFEEVES